MTTVMLTGFGPFLDVEDNPSWAIVSALAEHGEGPGTECVTVRLPVTHRGARRALEEAYRLWAPEVLVLLGVARSGTCRLEARAGHVITSSHADNDGEAPVGQLLGAGARHTRRDVAALVRQLSAAGHAVTASEDCGGYVCNSTYYAALGLDPGALFVHVPNALSPEALGAGRALLRDLLALLSGGASHPLTGEGP